MTHYQDSCNADLGRNDPCWCGSNLKYKKCHMEFDERLKSLARTGEIVPPRCLLKTPKDIEGIKKSAEVNVGVLDFVAKNIKEGISTEQIDKWVFDYTIEHEANPAPLGFEGYPKSVCTSINEVVCHGIPDAETILKDGDIINVDCSTVKDRYFSDSSRMFCIGNVSPELRNLVDNTKRAVEIGLEQVRPWGHIGDIGAAINEFCTQHGYTVVREFGGHGIGLEFHEEPFVSFVTKPNTGMILVPGLCFTIEPMVNLGKSRIDTSDPNGWTVRTKDKLATAQWEVQLVVTDDGYELLSW